MEDYLLVLVPEEDREKGSLVPEEDKEKGKENKEKGKKNKEKGKEDKDKDKEDDRRESKRSRTANIFSGKSCNYFFEAIHHTYNTPRSIPSYMSDNNECKEP